MPESNIAIPTNQLSEVARRHTFCIELHHLLFAVEIVFWYAEITVLEPSFLRQIDDIPREFSPTGHLWQRNYLRLDRELLPCRALVLVYWNSSVLPIGSLSQIPISNDTVLALLVVLIMRSPSRSYVVEVCLRREPQAWGKSKAFASQWSLSAKRIAEVVLRMMTTGKTTLLWNKKLESVVSKEILDHRLKLISHTFL